LRQLGFLVDWVRDGDAAERELHAQPCAAACSTFTLGIVRHGELEAVVAREGD